MNLTLQISTYLTENRIRRASGPVQFPIDSVTYIVLYVFLLLHKYTQAEIGRVALVVFSTRLGRQLYPKRQKINKGITVLAVITIFIHST